MLFNSLFRQWSFRIFAPGTMLREKYEAFKILLYHDSRCHELMADFQDLLHKNAPEDFARLRRRFSSLSDHVLGVIEALEAMAPVKYAALKNYHRKFDFYTRFLLSPPRLECSPPFCLEFADISSDFAGTGNKARHLAVLQNNHGISVPRGYCLTASAYHYFIEYNDLRRHISELLSELDIQAVEDLRKTSSLIRQLVENAEFPPVVSEEMLKIYDTWQKETQDDLLVAVRSNALHEDAAASFAGQYSSRLHVNRGELEDAVKEVIASKYLPEALFYRISRGYGDEETAMSVLIQEMVRPRCSGVIYTSTIERKNREEDLLHLHVVPGEGDKLVGGAVTPEYYALRKALPTEVVSESGGEGGLSVEELQKLTELGLRIEEIFNAPQDIEWAVDKAGEIHILQARTLRLAESLQEAAEPETGKKPEHSEAEILIDNATRAASGIASGPVHLLREDRDFTSIPEGAVLVTRHTHASLAAVINRVSAIIAEHGSRASHLATVAREFRIPLVVGVTGALDRFHKGDWVTVDGSAGRVHACAEKKPHRSGISQRSTVTERYKRLLGEALAFITPLELIDPEAENFTPEGCRSMHDIVRFSHEKALREMFTTARPGTGLGSQRLDSDIPLDVYVFDVGGGVKKDRSVQKRLPLDAIASPSFQALWKGLSHSGVQWKQKPFDWESFEKVELSGGVAPRRDSFSFASYAVIGTDYLHFNMRFGYHFTILDTLCSETTEENHCLLRFAGGGGDFDQRSLRLAFLAETLRRLEFEVTTRGDLLEAKMLGRASEFMYDKLDMLGRLLGASKLMDMVLHDERQVEECVESFFQGCYSFSERG